MHKDGRGTEAGEVPPAREPGPSKQQPHVTGRHVDGLPGRRGWPEPGNSVPQLTGASHWPEWERRGR